MREGKREGGREGGRGKGGLRGEEIMKGRKETRLKGERKEASKREGKRRRYNNESNLHF